MLRKLMKYELKATARIFLLLYGTVLALGLLNKLFFMMGIFGGNLPFPVELTAGLTMMMYFFVIGAIFVMTLIITIQRFYKNLLGDEGYLMFTLPVKPWQHIVSKMTVAIFWFIVSVFVTIFSGLMIGISFELLAELPDIFSQIMGEFYEYFSFHWLFFFLEILVLCLAGLCSQILMIYASMSAGHLFQKHRLIGSFASFLGFNFVMQLASGFFFVFLDVIGRKNWRLFHNLSLFNPNSLMPLHIGMLILIIWSLIICTVYFIFTNYILNRKLNLE